MAAQYVVAAVTGYFHSIACAANAKGVDDSLQVYGIPSIKALACSCLSLHKYCLHFLSWHLLLILFI